MRNGIAAVVAFATVVVLAGVAVGGGTTTTTTVVTTTTTSSTTTTTVPGGCVDDQSFVSVLCQLDALVALVDGSTDLGRFKQGVLNAVQKAGKQAGKASDSCTNKRTRSNQLKKSAQSLDSFRHKLDSNNAKRVIPSSTRDLLRSMASSIRSDINTLRASSGC
jgi:hypothetical protein